MGYESLPFAADLSSAMQDETSALINRVVFDEKRPWQDLFRSQDTYVSDLLAKNYGLPLPGSTTPKWVSYAGTQRRGILSHGSFLSNGVKFGDTSPTLRGKVVRLSLLCQDIPPPPPGVNADNPPPGTAATCKEDRYRAHAAGSCAGCHNQMDPIGFGLENYDGQGRFRTSELAADGKTVCPIDGKGTVQGTGDFNGPGQLGDLLMKSGLNHCLVQELYSYGIGRTVLDKTDLGSVDLMAKKIGGDADFKLDDLLLQFATVDAFRYRRQEP
jgi:hypothetical protein